MPHPTISINYEKCRPRECADGRCLAVSVCEFKVLRQEGPGEVPFVSPARWCHGCIKCARACPRQAIKSV